MPSMWAQHLQESLLEHVQRGIDLRPVDVEPLTDPNG